MEVAFLSRRSIRSCDTRGSRIDDDVGSHVSSFKPEVSVSPNEKRGNPLFLLSYANYATCTRPNLVVNLETP